MPSWRDLVPKKFMEAEDLPDGELIPVVIKGVRQLQFKAQGSPGQPATMDIVLALDLHGYKLPMRLNIPACKRLEALLGTDDTAAWVNRRINIYAGLVDVYGEPKPRIIIDDRPAMPNAAPQGAIAGARPAGLITGTTAKVPRLHVDRFRETAASFGESWDNFMEWTKREHPAAFELAYGKDLDSIPGSIILVMKAYLDHLKDAKNKPRQLAEAPAGDPAAAALAGRPAEPAQLGDEDIPF